MNKTKLFTLIFLLMTNNAIAKQSVETTPWGYSGIVNVPNSSVLDKGKFYINSAYTFRNPSFLSSFQMGLLDNLEIGVLGGLPSDIFSGLAGNVKYQVLKQNNNIPLSFAMGINLLGIKKVGNNNTFFNYGNGLYMIASHDLNINISDYLYNILSVHLGFSGNLDGSNLLAAVDIPVTRFINLGLEYTSKSNINNEMINFGIKIKPIEELSINFFSLGTNFSQGFTNTEYMLGLSYNTNIFPDNKNAQKIEDKKENPIKEEKKVSQQIPKEENKQNIKEETKKIENTNKEEKKIIQEASIKINIFDENDNSQISNVKALIESKENNLINKFDINESSHTISKLKYGEYKIILDKENYDTVVYPIKIDSISQNINIKMKKISSSILAKVFTNNSIPYPDLEIILNENIRTKTDKEGKFNFNNISPGKHIIKIIKNNQLIKKIDIDLLKGMELKREIYLDEIKNVSNSKTNISENKKNEVKEDIKKLEIKEEKIINKNTEQKTDSQNIKTDIKKEEKKSNNALVVGKISSSNKIIASARITLEGDKVTIMTISNKEGLYLIKNIPSGKYKITASKQGFIDKSSKIDLNENKQYKFDIILEKKN